MFPVGGLELVLHVEHPDAERGRERHQRQVHEQERLEPDEQTHSDDDRREPGIVSRMLRRSRFHSRGTMTGQAVDQHEVKGRSDDEEDQRMPIQPVLQSLPRGFARYSRTVSVLISPKPR